VQSAVNHVFNDVGGENVVTALALRCLNLDHLYCIGDGFHWEQQRCLDLLLQRKRLVAEAQALVSAPFSVVCQKLMQCSSHDYGHSAMLLILRDYIIYWPNSSCHGGRQMQAATHIVVKKRTSWSRNPSLSLCEQQAVGREKKQHLLLASASASGWVLFFFCKYSLLPVRNDDIE
jgi:hypothetical protein